MTAWIAIPGAVVLLAIIAYGFLQGMKVTTRQDGNPPEHSGGDFHN